MSPTDQLKVDAAVEGIKEFARLILVAAVSAALVAAGGYVTSIKDASVKFVATIVLAAILKAWDKKVHNDPTTERSGVIPF